MDMQGGKHDSMGMEAGRAGMGGAPVRSQETLPSFLQGSFDSSPEAVAIALLGQGLLPDGGANSATHVQPAALAYAANALAMLQSMQYMASVGSDAAARHPGMVCTPFYAPSGMGQVQDGAALASIHTARAPVRQNAKQEGEDLGPIVEVCGLQRREHGRRISAFNFFVKAMVPASPYTEHCTPQQCRRLRTILPRAFTRHMARFTIEDST